MARDLGLPDDAALGWLNLWDARNHPPKGEDRLREILASAHQYGKHEYGSGLAPWSFKRPFRLPRRNKYSRDDSISFDISL